MCFGVAGRNTATYVSWIPSRAQVIDPVWPVSLRAACAVKHTGMREYDSELTAILPQVLPVVLGHHHSPGSALWSGISCSGCLLTDQLIDKGSSLN